MGSAAPHCSPPAAAAAAAPAGRHCQCAATNACAALPCVWAVQGWLKKRFDGMGGQIDDMFKEARVGGWLGYWGNSWKVGGAGPCLPIRSLSAGMQFCEQAALQAPSCAHHLLPLSTPLSAAAAPSLPLTRVCVCGAEWRQGGRRLLQSGGAGMIAARYSGMLAPCQRQWHRWGLTTHSWLALPQRQGAFLAGPDLCNVHDYTLFI